MILILEHPVNDPFKYSGKLGYQALKPNWYFYCTNLQKLGTCKYKNINKIPNTVQLEHFLLKCTGRDDTDQEGQQKTERNQKLADFTFLSRIFQSGIEIVTLHIQPTEA